MLGEGLEMKETGVNLEFFQRAGILVLLIPNF